MDSVYKALQLKGYYLPDLKSACITSDYLKGILFKEFFSLTVKDVQHGQCVKNVSKN